MIAKSSVGVPRAGIINTLFFPKQRVLVGPFISLRGERPVPEISVWGADPCGFGPDVSAGPADRESRFLYVGPADLRAGRVRGTRGRVRGTRGTRGRVRGTRGSANAS